MGKHIDLQAEITLCDKTISVKIIQQDERDRCRDSNSPLHFTASNGFKIYSRYCPELVACEDILYIRGYNRHINNNKDVKTFCNETDAIVFYKRLKEAIEEFNAQGGFISEFVNEMENGCVAMSVNDFCFDIAVSILEDRFVDMDFAAHCIEDKPVLWYGIKKYKAFDNSCHQTFIVDHYNGGSPRILSINNNDYVNRDTERLSNEIKHTILNSIQHIIDFNGTVYVKRAED